jgi:hypothetical protein
VRFASPTVISGGTRATSITLDGFQGIHRKSARLSTVSRKSLIDNTKDLGPLPPNAKLFTMDTTSMYTNIQPDVAINAIQQCMEAYPNTVPKNVQQKLLIKLLEIIMRRNVFSFDNTSWLQEIRTAMGTPCACSYATLSYALHILATFTDFIMILKCFIDDMFGIWIGGEGGEWKQCKHALEGFGKLKWICSDLSDTVVLLDLYLTITSDGHVETKTYIKPKNLHLYIPATSAHPPGCFKGTLYGNVQRYWNQNSNIKDYQTLVQAFAKHLEARGQKIDNVTQTLLEVAIHTDEKNEKNNKNKQKTLTTDTKKLFIHWEYHPNDIDQTMNCQIYKETLEGHDGFDAIPVCYSRLLFPPKNLRDELCSTVLNQPESEKMSQILTNPEMKTTNTPLVPPLNPTVVGHDGNGTISEHQPTKT